MSRARKTGHQNLFLLGVAALALVPLPAVARDFYVDPVNGSPSGDGSMANPWRTIEEVLSAGLVETRFWDSLPYDGTQSLVPKNAGAPVKAGDTIWLASGYHGELRIERAHNAQTITIAAMPGATPKVRRIFIRSASRWTIQGLSVSPSFAPNYTPNTAVEIDSHGYSGPSYDVRIEGCTIFSVPDTSTWTAADWRNNAVDGVVSDAPDIAVVGNTLTNVHFGISMSGPRAQVIGNTIRNFSGDGMRGLGDNSLFEDNYVANSYKVDANHDDGFQSWSRGPNGVGSGEVKGIVLRGNIIINREDPNQPLAGDLQGIGCFDGFYTDWVVENNVIIVDHWHGITLTGARNSRIVNNTVIDMSAGDPTPWIRIAVHKDGTSGSGNVIRNNLTPKVLTSPGTTEDHNILITDPAQHFVSATRPWDLHLLASSTAIDAGDANLAPTTDRDGVPRPYGAAVDVGAYEWTPDGVPPTDGGTPDAGAASDAGTSTDAGNLDAGGGGGDAGNGGDGGGSQPDGGGGQPDGGGAQFDGGNMQPDGGGEVRDGGASEDAGAVAGDGGATSADGGSSPGGETQGCGCATVAARGKAGALWAVLALGAFGLRRRERGA